MTFEKIFVGNSAVVLYFLFCWFCLFLFLLFSVRFLLFFVGFSVGVLAGGVCLEGSV